MHRYKDHDKKITVLLLEFYERPPDDLADAVELVDGAAFRNQRTGVACLKGVGTVYMYYSSRVYELEDVPSNE